jgi:hypothetical protein
LQYLDASPGIFLKKDGGSVVFLANGHAHPGSVQIGIGRSDRTKGIRGSGVLCRLRFLVLSPGATDLKIAGSRAWSEDGAGLSVRTKDLRLTF